MWNEKTDVVGGLGAGRTRHRDVRGDRGHNMAASAMTLWLLQPSDNGGNGATTNVAS